MQRHVAAGGWKRFIECEPKKSNLTIPCMVHGSKNTNRHAVVTLHPTTLFSNEREKSWLQVTITQTVRAITIPTAQATTTPVVLPVPTVPQPQVPIITEAPPAITIPEVRPVPAAEEAEVQAVPGATP
jgi:hypothetical protein